MNHYVNDISGWNHECAGKNCRRLGVSILKVSFINMKGRFCTSCAEDLLRRGLATMERDKKSEPALESVPTPRSNAKTNHRTGDPNDGQQ